MRGDRKGLGEYLYFEWLYPVKDYFKSTSKNELVFEMLMPLGISLITTIIYANNNLVAVNGKYFPAKKGIYFPALSGK